MKPRKTIKNSTTIKTKFVSNPFAVYNLIATIENCEKKSNRIQSRDECGAQSSKCDSVRQFRVDCPLDTARVFRSRWCREIASATQRNKQCQSLGSGWRTIELNSLIACCLSLLLDVTKCGQFVESEIIEAKRKRRSKISIPSIRSCSIAQSFNGVTRLQHVSSTS